MNRDPYPIALNSALSEIHKAYPDIKHSFIFTDNKSIVAKDQEMDQKTVDNILESFENLKEKAQAIGNLESFHINAKEGKLTLTKIHDMYLVLAADENADKSDIYSITQVIIPTILKTVEALAPTKNEDAPPKELVVDTLSGFFAGDSVQIDAKTITEWTKISDPRARVKATITGEQNPQVINHVRIETMDGNSTLCKVKEINDQRLKGKNLIRIPEKVCEALEIKKGNLVKVKPLL